MRPFKGRREPRLLHLDEWPAQTGQTPVLIENLDRADLRAHADVLYAADRLTNRLTRCRTERDARVFRAAAAAVSRARRSAPARVAANIT